MIIAVVGDSHTEAFYGSSKLNDFRKIHISLATAYNSKKHIPYIVEQLHILQTREGKIDYLFFCFGEIDIRCHLGFQSEITNRTYEEVVEDCVNRYFETVEHFNNLGYKVGIYGPIASGTSQATANGHKSYKTYKERNVLTKLFNDYLIELCKQKGIIYKSIFDYIINDQENYSLYYAQDQLHLNLGMFQREKNHIDVAQIIYNTFSDLLPND